MPLRLLAESQDKINQSNFSEVCKCSDELVTNFNKMTLWKFSGKLNCLSVSQLHPLLGHLRAGGARGAEARAQSARASECGGQRQGGGARAQNYLSGSQVG